MRFIFVNGEQTEYPRNLSVFELLLQFGLVDKEVAVERNFEIVPKSKFKDIFLVPDDKIEIVNFIGGG